MLQIYWPGFLQCACGLTAWSHGWVSQIGLTDGSHNGLTKRSHKKVSQEGRTKKTHRRGAPVGRTGVTMVSQKYGLVRRMGAPGRTEWAHRWPLWLCPYVRKQNRLTQMADVKNRLQRRPFETATIAFSSKSPGEAEKHVIGAPQNVNLGLGRFCTFFAVFARCCRFLHIFAGSGVSLPSFRPGRFCTFLPVPAGPVSPVFGGRVPSCPVGLPGPAVKIRTCLLLFALCATGPLVLALCYPENAGQRSKNLFLISERTVTFFGLLFLIDVF